MATSVCDIIIRSSRGFCESLPALLSSVRDRIGGRWVVVIVVVVVVVVIGRGRGGSFTMRLP